MRGIAPALTLASFPEIRPEKKHNTMKTSHETVWVSHVFQEIRINYLLVKILSGTESFSELDLLKSDLLYVGI